MANHTGLLSSAELGLAMDFQQSTWEQPNPQYARVVDGTVLLALATLVLYTASKHEPWADEAQAWLLARDFPFVKLVLSELRYEGHPLLWFAILSPAIHVFHLPYAYFGYLAGCLAISGLGALIFLAPFPRVLRYLIAFSFFFVYQYAVIARPYVLMPLLGFLAAHLYRQGLSRITNFAAVTSLLIQVSSYAAVIAFGLTSIYSIQLLFGWKEIAHADRRRIVRAAGPLTLSALFLIAVLYPRSDSSLAAEAAGRSLQQRFTLVGEGLSGAFADSTLAALPLLVMAGIWAYWQGKSILSLLVLTVGGTALEYGFLRGFAHHQGLITISFVVFLWVAWPSPAQLKALRGTARWLQRCTLAVLILTFGWQCTWSYHAIWNDWSGPYTGARDAATYLKSAGADKLGCSGYGFWAVGIQPYFEHNLFINYGSPSAPATYHFSFDFVKRSDTLTDQQLLNGPPFILASYEYDDLRQAVPLVETYRSFNYALVHYSDGTKFFKSGAGVHAVYFIFERIDFLTSGATAK